MFNLLFLFIVYPLLAFTTECINYTHFILKDKTHIHVIEIDPNYFDIVLKEAENAPLETVEEIAKDENAVAAINGGFFFRKGELKYEPSGILKIGTTFRSLAFLPRGAIGWSNDNKKPLFDRVLTKTEKNGSITVLPESYYTKKEDWQDVFYILGGTPLLIQNGSLITDYKDEKTISSFLTEKHPRSAIGVLKNGNFIFLTVDGTRNFFFKNSGITIENLALLMYNLDCQEALNLDGGGSSTLYFENSIQNKPCGEFLDNRGFFVRKVANAILAIPKKHNTIYQK